VVSMTSDARRFCFPSIELFGFSRQSQIWVADINPEKIPEASPIISETLMDPGLFNSKNITIKSH